MMFSIEFYTDNAAFADGNETIEIARILTNVGARILDGQREGAVRDENGNKVGLFRFKAEAHDAEAE